MATDNSARAELLSFIDTVGATTGRPALSEHKEIGLRRARASSIGIVVRDEAGIVGYAQLETGTNEPSAELVVRPDADGGALRSVLVAGLRAEVARRGGGRLALFLDDPGPDTIAAIEADGFVADRELLVLRREAHPGDAQLARNEPFAPFRPGIDEDAFLELNRRAFSWHPEQGAWDAETLAERERQPWFAPEGFLLAHHGDRLVGACWTKVHGPPENVGEIYVLAVDPDAQGHGLGRRLLEAGLARLALAGQSATLLWVDGNNDAALPLYRSAGFESASRTVVLHDQVAAG